MVDTNYLPERGDIVLTDFNPQKGKEQAGYRPAFIVSPFAYNKMASLPQALASKASEELVNETGEISGFYCLYFYSD
jgi:mRNA-degrading endonuclease toxin of MazEF toxin-antitoxin module